MKFCHSNHTTNQMHLIMIIQRNPNQKLLDTYNMVTSVKRPTILLTTKTIRAKITSTNMIRSICKVLNQHMWIHIIQEWMKAMKAGVHCSVIYIFFCFCIDFVFLCASSLYAAWPYPKKYNYKLSVHKRN